MRRSAYPEPCTTRTRAPRTGNFLPGEDAGLAQRLDEPLPGTAWIGSGTISGQVTDIVSLYYYGEGAAEAAARDQADLGSWLQTHVAAAPI